jgi:hypothetical protein
MGDLILRTRTEMSRRSLGELGTALEAIDERRQTLKQVVTCTDAAWRSVERMMGQLQIVGAELPRDAPKPLFAALKDLAAEAQLLQTHINGMQEAATPIRLRELAFDKNDRPANLKNLLDNGARARLETLAKVEDFIAPKPKNGQPPPPPDLSSAWAEYHQAVLQDREHAFTEYVDLMSGFALREAGLDREICRIADTLVNAYGPTGKAKWNSLTVPAHHETLGATMAQIIRLGFPEWTIWALPMAATQFGYVVMEDPSTTLGDYAAQHLTGSEEERARGRICLADAYATQVMGPAYAAAAILMRLEPLEAYSDEHERLTAHRAAVILETLKPSQEMQTDPFGNVRQTLQREWDDALAQTGSRGRLTEAEQEQIEAWVAAVRDAVYPPFTLNADRWVDVKTWADALAKGNTNQVQFSGDEAPLRYILNAAWLARLDAAGPDEIMTIETATQAVWNRLDEDLRRASQQQTDPLGLSLRGQGVGGSV